MIDTQYLTKVFKDKLAETGSFDAAFLKAVWVAYQQGYNELDWSGKRIDEIGQNGNTGDHYEKTSGEGLPPTDGVRSSLHVYDDNTDTRVVLRPVKPKRKSRALCVVRRRRPVNSGQYQPKTSRGV